MATVDYRMARRATLRALQVGLVSRVDVCDAHPELLRAAKHLGEEAGEECPVCAEEALRLVLYTFGKGLKRANGSARRQEDIRDLARTVDEMDCYVVEVCTECNWNHLIRSFGAGRRYAG